MSMSLLLTPLVKIFRYTLQPIAPFTWFGSGFSTLDLVATFRLCLVLRQLREIETKNYAKAKGAGVAVPQLEESSYARSVGTTLLVVFGGEVFVGPFLGVPPSFMLSGVVPLIYAVVQAIVDYFPVVPEISVNQELPLSILDGITRSYLLCTLIPPAVLSNTNNISQSPWALLMSAMIITNGGFFLTHLFSLLKPIPLTLQTPPDLLPYGWVAIDFWCPAVFTGLYAFLTHAQPFWHDLHSVLAQALGASSLNDAVKPPLDAEQARALCALLLAVLFFGRTAKNFGLWKGFDKTAPKMKTQ